MIDIIVPSRNEIDFFWPDFMPLVESTFKYGGGEASIKDMKESWENGNVFYLGFYDHGELLGIASMELIHFPQKTIVNVPIVAGKDIDKWFDVGFERISQLGKEFGASEVRSRGRKGWERMLRNKGFTHEYTILSRTIQ